MVEVYRSKGGPAGSTMTVTMTLTLDLEGAVEVMTSPSGVIGRGVLRAAEVVKDRAVAFQSAAEYTTPTAHREGRVGRWRTGDSTQNITTRFTHDAYHARAVLSPGTDYWHFQELGTRWIAPAPVMGRALLSLRPADFL